MNPTSLNLPPPYPTDTGTLRLLTLFLTLLFLLGTLFLRAVQRSQYKEINIVDYYEVYQEAE